MLMFDMCVANHVHCQPQHHTHSSEESVQCEVEAVTLRMNVRLNSLVSSSFAVMMLNKDVLCFTGTVRPKALQLNHCYP